jgi:hypothetical protein
MAWIANILDKMADRLHIKGKSPLVSLIIWEVILVIALLVIGGIVFAMLGWNMISALQSFFGL